MKSLQTQNSNLLAHTIQIKRSTIHEHLTMWKVQGSYPHFLISELCERAAKQTIVGSKERKNKNWTRGKEEEGRVQLLLLGGGKRKKAAFHQCCCLVGRKETEEEERPGISAWSDLLLHKRNLLLGCHNVVARNGKSSHFLSFPQHILWREWEMSLAVLCRV